MTTCIIAEKPSVARDIARIVGANSRQDGYLEGNGYFVTWAMGHLIALAMPEAYGFTAYKAEDLPIRPNPFQLIVRQVRKDKEYISDPAALKRLKIIRSCFDRADRIIVATDAGREGELIFRWIYAHLGCRKPFYRLWISSLTDKAIREGMANLKSGNNYENLYHSAQARAEADWLVGINASRALSIARRGGYSLGRVQTPTLAMVCRRYIENRDFSSAPYWKLSAFTEKDGMSLKAIGVIDYESEASAQTALAALRSQSRLTIESVTRKVGHTSPPLLYDLTALQKEANRCHGFSADKTLSIAQSLYEKKITTYPRTGSRYISEDVFEEVPVLLRKIGKTLSNPLNRHSVDNDKVTDHHAIIPTGETPQGLSADEVTVYQMVVTRFVEAFSPDSEEERVQVQFTDDTNIFTWKACRQISLGWKAVQKNKATETEEKEDGDEQVLSSLPNLPEGEVLPLVDAEITEHKTKPKPLYTEATLLSAMENAGREVEDAESKKAMAECGIGTPATRANIIETLILRDYIRREKKAIVPTEKGLAVYEIVKDKKIANAEMTGSWELALAAIEAGQMPPERFAQGINSYISTICEELLSLASEQKSYPTYRCPECGSESVGIYAKVAKCRNKDCNFHVFREVCGTLLSEDNIRDLLTTGRTPILNGLTSKAGKKFNARLVLNEDYTTSFEFENKKGKQRGR
ncbi:type IA DNA topoisomerase [Porphyromonas endodontalis]|uniref:DNA topoisomerase n=1 Tax=Porphyromonas endodontalis (strain ATCC 35406 / DSM 24491 / JCM 8526 / CCUG 16442 / BCRC 14492 / NCTC 13058 / HG 370) TaxID=553175 RepID=C3JCM7_POREA|nr:type IA DNA topoisomerase [Porphyromonas endodontalis]EEN82059.1 DNA topoisomerase [Porphyromonas endodontalis ATCC 35406]UBH64472.1 DNA topoisomerase III [Porphyromonas endodontalis]SUB76545.1 DNA topoisomerase 3 [Porphyromonas endodontalis]